MKCKLKPMKKLENKIKHSPTNVEIEGAKNAPCYCPDKDLGWEAGWLGMVALVRMGGCIE